MADDELGKALTKVLAPMIESDEGELFLVQDTPKLIHLHLRGRFAGCPGNELANGQVIRPLLEAIRPKAKLDISSGAIVPPQAKRIRPAS